MAPNHPDGSGSSSSRPKRRGGWGIVLRIGVTAVLLGLLAWGLDLGAAGGTLANSLWGLVALALVANLASQVVTTVRWWRLVAALDLPVRYSTLFLWYFHGMFFSLCLPTSIGGDVYKAVRLGQATQRLGLATCTLLADRAIGLSALVIIGLAGLLTQTLGWNALGMLTAILGLSLIFGVLGFAALWLLPPVARFLPGGHVVASRLAQLAPYRDSPVVLSAAYGLSLIVQLLNVATVALLGAAVGLPVPWEAYFMAVPPVILLAALPLSIGGLGVREGALAVALASFGVTHEQGLAVGVLWFVVLLACGLLGGAIYLLAPAAPGAPAELPETLPMAAGPGPATLPGWKQPA